jgi:hypothetical protein
MTERKMRGRIYLAVDPHAVAVGDIVDYRDGGQRVGRVTSVGLTHVSVAATVYAGMTVRGRRRVHRRDIVAVWRLRSRAEAHADV